jgi:diguanylate cyclase (GGDEF)-like protein
MKQSGSDSTIHIVTLSPKRGEAIQRMLALRGFDEIRCIGFEQASSLKRSQPALVIVDGEHQPAALEAFFHGIPAGLKSLVLSDIFDESLFVLCHDRGARDFITKPVSEAYLISRVIRVLQEHRLEQLIRQKDNILVEQGVLSANTGIFSTSYLMKRLQELSEEQALDASRPLSLLLIRLDGEDGDWTPAQWQAIRQETAKLVRECARGMDVVGEYLVDKFAIILPRTGRRGARTLATRLSDRLAKMSAIHQADGKAAIRISIGLAEYDGCRHYEDLLDRTMEHLNAGETLPAIPARFEV